LELKRQTVKNNSKSPNSEKTPTILDKNLRDIEDVWEFCAIERALWRNTHTGKLLLDEKGERRWITLKESVEKFQLFDEFETDCTEFGDAWHDWLKDISKALPVGKTAQ
jgi:hypothetical protein